MTSGAEIGFPQPTTDERDLFLRWLAFLRGAVVRKATGVSDSDARWTPEGALISLVGIVNHLTHVERRWIDGTMLGERVGRSEEEFAPGLDLSIGEALAIYHNRAARTDAIVRGFDSLDQPCTLEHGEPADLRWVLLHLINETARHAGHADAVRQLLDGTTGE